MTDEELGREIMRGQTLTPGMIGARARALLTKPVATREAVMVRLDEMPNRTTWNANTVTQIMDALQHFAAPDRPKMMIEGMTVEDIELHMAPFTGLNSINIDTAARVAHRLANTPAPVVDDAKAMELAWKWRTSVMAPGDRGPHDMRRHWHDMKLIDQDRWRAVAKEVGGE